MGNKPNPGREEGREGKGRKDPPGSDPLDVTTTVRWLLGSIYCRCGYPVNLDAFFFRLD